MGILLVAVSGSLYALLGDSGLVAVMQMRARATQLRYEIGAAERANQELRERIRPLRDGDPAAIEREARQRLYMVRPGETLYLLPPAPESEAPVLRESASPTGPPSPARR